MIHRDDAILVLIDVQTKLMQAMPDHEQLAVNLNRIVRGMELLGVPTLVTEQLPEKLGSTLPSITMPAGTRPISKKSFSCWGAAAFRDALTASERRTVILAGIETHVCVYQTAMNLLEEGYGVVVLCDGVSSRSPANRDLALHRLDQEGASLCCTEMLLFELLEDADHPAFKSVLQLVK